MNLRRHVAAGLAGCFVAAAAFAQSGYKFIAQFDEGRVAHLAFSVEYKPDKSRSIDLRVNRNPYGGSLFLH